MIRLPPFVAFVFVMLMALTACTGSSDDRGSDEEVAELRSEIEALRADLEEARSAPAAAPSTVVPTPEFSDAVEQVATDIEQTTALAESILLVLDTFDLGAGSLPLLEGAWLRCDDALLEPILALESTPWARSGLHRFNEDLWPREYLELSDGVVFACSTIGLEVSLRDIAVINSSHGGFAELIRSFDARPDFSAAQLRRAIAERE